MCGICGVSSRQEITKLDHVIERMNASITHRGPDGAATRTFGLPGIPQISALGFSRLAIIDLSDAGMQPMGNEDGTIWVVFNGEIYNFPELRAELVSAGHDFRSRTDTEVLVHLYEELGPKCVERLNGMFAMAFLDVGQGRLVLARDHVGIKPLYYLDSPDHFLFGSEIKAILASGLYQTQVDMQSIYDYFTYLYVPGPETAFLGIKQLPPAHVLEYDLRKGSADLYSYWSPRRDPDIEQASLEELIPQARQLMDDSVQRQLVSDVPLGVFLSGGVDSTILTALASQHDSALATFTVTFEGNELAAYNEQAAARVASKAFGTCHHELTVAATDLKAMLSLVTFFDQPFGNPTFYLQHLMSEAARKHVTVALSGAGGDELYAGYPRYRALQLVRKYRWMPRQLLRLGRVPLGPLRDSYRTMRLRRAREFLAGLDKDPVLQFANWTYFLNAPEKERLLGETSAGYRSERCLRQALERSHMLEEDNRWLDMDLRTFLVDNLLEYTDKMSMAASLETRVPYLDYRFVEFSLNVPFRYKLHRGHDKILLREAFNDLLPPTLQAAPKRGFNAPLAHWMVHNLGSYFDPDGSDGWRDDIEGQRGITWREGIVDYRYIQQLRRQLMKGQRDTSYPLFAIIMFDVWWRRYISNSVPFGLA